MRSYVQLRELAKARAHSSHLATALAASLYGLALCPTSTASPSTHIHISRSPVRPTRTPSTLRHQMVKWEALGQRWLVRRGWSKRRLGTPPSTYRPLRSEPDRLSPSQTSFGVTISGEYSNGINDCGVFLQGTGPYTPANPDCAAWNNWEGWDQNTKAGLLNFALASMDALENPFFWTWKVRMHAWLPTVKF